MKNILAKAKQALFKKKKNLPEIKPEEPASTETQAKTLLSKEIAEGEKKTLLKTGLSKPGIRGLSKLTSLSRRKTITKKKRKFDLRRFIKTINLNDYLEKAGLEGVDPKKVSKTIFRINTGICIAVSIVITLINIYSGKGFLNLLVFLLGFWLTVFFVLLAFIWAAYLFYLDMRIYQRTKAVEAVFADFLQLTSANISAGMPIDRALWYAVRPGFGVLAKEIETVAKKTMAGEDLGAALTNFANKYNSRIIQRSISLLLEGMQAGGEMAELLTKIALNIEETKLIKKEMASSVTTYVIFITFATIIAAPILFGLSTELLEVIKAITSSLGTTMTSSGSFLSFSFSGDSIKISDFRTFAYLLLSISAVSSACIISIIRKGRVKEAIPQIPVFIVVSLTIYTIAAFLIKGIFAGVF